MRNRRNDADSFGSGRATQRSGCRPLSVMTSRTIIMTVSGQTLMAARSGSAARVMARPCAVRRGRAAASLGRHLDISDRAALLLTMRMP